MTVPSRFPRRGEAQARELVARLARVAREHDMQDWPLEVSDPTRLPEFILLYEQASRDDVRFVLMELILFSLDAASENDPELSSAVQRLLLEDCRLHSHTIIYWSCLAETSRGWRFVGDDDEHFVITPLARSVLRACHDEIGFAELLVEDRSDASLLRSDGAMMMAARLAHLLANAEEGQTLETRDDYLQLLGYASWVAQALLVRRFPEELSYVGLDGFLRTRARIEGTTTLSWRGFCYLLPEGLAPVAVRVSIAADRESLAHLWCGLGERQKDGDRLLPIPYEPGRIEYAVAEASARLDLMEWAFEATATSP